MKYTFKLEKPPLGYAVAAARAGDPHVQVARIGMFTDDDGEQLIKRLDGVTAGYLARAPRSIRPASVENLFAVVMPSGDVTVQINEGPLVVSARSTRAIQKGEPLRGEDIGDFVEARPGDLHVPADAGFVAVMSVGWRRAMFFDYTPLAPTNVSRSYRVERVLGELLNWLHFRNRFTITEAQWEALFAHGWFPFIGLPDRLVELMLTHAEEGWDFDDLTESLRTATRMRCEHIRGSLDGYPFLDGHRTVIQQAIDKFLQDDYLSCSAILYPRLEGVLRSRRALIEGQDRRSARGLSLLAVAGVEERVHARSLLLPDRFARYLDEVLFASFDPNQPTGVSRHSVAHGVAPEARLHSVEAACFALLSLGHLLHALGKPSDMEAEPTSSADSVAS